MADVELVVKIPEELYKNKKGFLTNMDAHMICDAVKKGTQLPEHHGDLKDASNIIELLVSRKYDKKAGSDDLVKGYNLGIDAAIRLIRHVDAVIPATEPPHWIERRLSMGIHDWTCSVCKCQHEEPVDTCPNCGVHTGGRYEMEGENEKEQMNTELL